MSRLIDADVFEKFIKEKYKDGESTDDIKDQMLFDLSYQPTTYNVEQVVEELEEKKHNFSGGALQSFYYWRGIEEAIEIVKGGGVNG